MRLVTAIETIGKLRDENRRAGRKVGLVPTMGALHDGHGSLVRKARAECEVVIASIFVNPLQFGPKEDFEQYPRDLEGDRAKLESWGCDVLFTTSPSAMYPNGFQTFVTPEGPLSAEFDGAVRPGHFKGVATVVLKLLNLTGCDIAYFGRKDAQQCALIRRMALDLNVPSKISVCPTAREQDGLAMSSRNVYLTPAQRAAAPNIYKALLAARARVQGGERDALQIREALARDLAAIEGGSPDYADVVDPDSFERIQQKIPGRFGAPAPALAIAVVRFGSTRLLDNLRLDEDGS
ncbi:MAG: pantoate--beta-alanine ligase [Planctomycetes bacterium]|nr:pantoate--beta-alanine ligase [Planctomycetota bacterium]